MVAPRKKGESPTAKQDEAESSPSPPWSSLFAFSTRSHALLLVIAITLAIISGVIVPVLAYILGRMFNNFSSFGGGKIDSDQLTSDIRFDVFLLLALGVASWLCNGCFFSVWMSFGEMQAKNARMALYNAMMAKDVAWYETQTAGPAATMARFQTQIREVQIATSQPLGLTIQHVATVLASLGLAFYSCWDLTLVTLAAVPVGVFALAFISAQMQPAVEKQNEWLTAATKHMKSMLEAIEVVKCFNAQVMEGWKYADIIKESGKHYRTLARANASQIGCVRILVRTLFVSGFWYGSHLVSNGNRTSGQILTTFWSCLMATQVFEQILPQMIVLEKGRTAGSVLKEFLGNNTGPDDDKVTHLGKYPDKLDGDIFLKNVSFAYPSREARQSLDNVSLFFPAGETTYVVGRSGSGKSTFAALLIRLYDSLEGEIFIDKDRIDDLDLHWLRKNIAIVQQDSILFDDTVLRNIAFGRAPDLSVKQSALNAAIDLACLRSTLEDLPNGLDTFIGVAGTQLSGGQTQRVALARARLRDTPVLILDEATSALDKGTADTVMQNILSWRTGKTTIIITHDLSQVGPDDFTYVLDQGKVVQEGYRYKLEAAKDSHLVKMLRNMDAESVLSYRPGYSLMSSRAESMRVRQVSQVFSESTTLVGLSDGEDDFAGNTMKPLPASPPKAYPKPGRSVALGRRRSIVRNSVVSALSGSTYHADGADGTRFSMIGTSITVPSAPLKTLPSPHPASTTHYEVTPSRRLGSVLGSRHFRKGHQSWMSMQDEEDDMELQQRRPFKPATPCARDSWLVAETGRDEQVELHLSDPDSSKNHKRAKGDAPASTPFSLVKILSTIWPKLSATEKCYLTAGFSFGAIHAVCTPVFSYIFSKLLATYYLPGNKTQLALQWSLTLLGVALIDASASYMMHYLLEVCAEAWVYAIRYEATKQVLLQPKSWFESEEAKLNQIVQHLDRGAEEMKTLLGRFAGLLFTAAIMTTTGIVWCMAVSWQLTLVGISAAPAVYGITRAFDHVSAVWEGKSNGAGEVAAGVFGEAYAKIKTIRSLTLETHFKVRYSRATLRARQVGNRRALIAGLFFGIADASIDFVTALVFWYGAVLASSGKYPVTSITTVFSMLLFVITNVHAIISWMPQLSSSRETATSLLRLTQLNTSDNPESTGDVRMSKLPGNIYFRNVRFSYPSRPDALALDRLNLEIPLGTSTALVGLSGSGKSTIVSLLFRLYPLGSSRSPHSRMTSSTSNAYDKNTDRDRTQALSSGWLDVHDLNVSQIEISNWRSLLAYVPQVPVLFPGTISQNIAYGLPTSSPHNTPTAIRSAAATAGIDTFIRSLPDGYETLGGEGGTGLSGGQRQKLGIARALVRRPELLVLDEPTSALDATSAEDVRSLVRGLVRAGKTVLVVTHSVEMMKACERVCVLDAGKVVDSGSFGELMGSDGTGRPRCALRKVLGMSGGLGMSRTGESYER